MVSPFSPAMDNYIDEVPTLASFRNRYYCHYLTLIYDKSVVLKIEIILRLSAVKIPQ